MKKIKNISLPEGAIMLCAKQWYESKRGKISMLTLNQLLRIREAYIAAASKLN